MAVEVRQTAGTRGALDSTHQLGGPGFFLDLLVDEPMHEHLRGVIMVRERRCKHGVDALRVGLLHCLRLENKVEQRGKILLGCGERLQLRLHATIDEMIDHFPCVLALLARLFGEEPGKPLQVLHGTPD